MWPVPPAQSEAPGQHTLNWLTVRASTPIEVGTVSAMLCASSRGGVTVAGCASVAKRAELPAFQAPKSASHTPYRAWRAAGYVAALVSVCGSCWPVPNETSTRGSASAPCPGTEATVSRVVIGWALPAENSGAADTFHAAGSEDVRSKRQTLPCTSPA